MSFVMLRRKIEVVDWAKNSINLIKYHKWCVQVLRSAVLILVRIELDWKPFRFFMYFVKKFRDYQCYSRNPKKRRSLNSPSLSFRSEVPTYKLKLIVANRRCILWKTRLHFHTIYIIHTLLQYIIRMNFVHCTHSCIVN